MRKDLYKELLRVEETHWWHKAKQDVVFGIFSRLASQNPKRNLRVLDVGCGTGKIIQILKPIAGVWGMDSSQEALRFCRQRGIDDVVEGAAEKTPFANGFYDAICFLDVLEHVDDVVALQEAHRVLSKNGLVVITVPAYMFLWSEWDRVLGHKRRYALRQLKTVLETNGFVIHKLSYFHSFLLLPVLFVRGIRGLFLKQKQYSSDFMLNNSVTNCFFGFLSRLEQFFMRRYDMPFGTSILCIAQKK